MSKYSFTAQRDDYLTPPEIINAVLKKHKKNIFGLDTCCSISNIPAVFRYKKDGLYGFNDQIKFNEDDGLTGPWSDFNWCNPPFPLCREFVKKAADEQKQGKTTVMLIPARTETVYWSEYILEDGRANKKNVDVEFLRKGICFINPDTRKKMPVFKNSLALVTFKGDSNG